ncbi:MAG: GDPmannose 4,6-dehydratase [Parcubacteria group bacterium Gr01-1014_106]|nr:MAG: GDPmannose 4,6-dehydratase [Parcubacteria group bacterium Gr01-1014_106]
MYVLGFVWNLVFEILSLCVLAVSPDLSRVSTMQKRALITGITGQDGSYLAELLLDKGYEVFGLLRRSSTLPFERIRHIQDRLRFVSGDLLEEQSLIRALEEAKPHEVYNLAAQSFVQTSWDQPVLTGEITALGVTRLLNAIRMVDPAIRFYQASSSEMFGNSPQIPQSEDAPFYPRSPYGIAKVYGHGALQAIMCRRCGSCCSRTRPKTMLLGREKRMQCGSLLTSRFVKSG